MSNGSSSMKVKRSAWKILYCTQKIVLKKNVVAVSKAIAANTHASISLLRIKNAYLTTIHFLHNISHGFSLRTKHADLWRLTISDQNVIFGIHAHPIWAQELSLSPILAWANFQKEVSEWIKNFDTVVHVVADDDVVVEIHGAVER